MATDNGQQVPLDRASVLELAAGQTASFDLAAGGHWYGHGFNHLQPYPLETGSVANPAFAVNNIQSPVWMCSTGAAILAETARPLAVRLNEGGDGRWQITAGESPVTLRIFKGRDLPAARAQLMEHVGWPNRPPATEMFGDCLFCTWTQYPRCLTQDRVLDMARQIRAQGYPCSTLIIDDRWESCFGELEFSRDFPNPGRLVDELHALGFTVWLWVTPFVNEEAAGFTALAQRGVLRPGRLRWWGGTAGLVDVTAPAGRAWYRERLQRLRDEYGVDGFKIDGGDFKYQPAPGALEYSDRLLELFEELVPNQCETRTAWLSQRRAVLWREGGKDSHWGLDNGLKALVTLGLHLGLLGYDILIPDMVPGRVQTLVATLPLPTDELMVRWTEASAFFPMLQFSYFPWNYAEPTARAVLAYARVHKALAAYIAEQARDRRAPLLRPIWFDAPAETGLYGLADEFMLGSDLLVAPVLDPGITQRDVVLPAGEWVDAWTGRRFAGGWIRSHPAPCPGLPLFVRAGRANWLAPALAAIARGSVPPGVTTTRYAAGLDRDLNVTG